MYRLFKECKSTELCVLGSGGEKKVEVNKKPLQYGTPFKTI